MSYAGMVCMSRSAKRVPWLTGGLIDVRCASWPRPESLLVSKGFSRQFTAFGQAARAIGVSAMAPLRVAFPRLFVHGDLGHFGWMLNAETSLG